MNLKKIYIIAGEKSGDLHSSELISQLINLSDKKNLTLNIKGYGGNKMREKCKGITDWLEESAVLGVWEVIKKYSYFKNKMTQITQEIINFKPDIVIFVDYPGFNLRLANDLKKINLSCKKIFYISPQIWAWKKNRVYSMARMLDLVLCIFPFEPKYYQKSGLKAKFIGHPFANMNSNKQTALRNKNHPKKEFIISFFPGSRMNEIKKLLPTMAETANKILHSKFENIKLIFSVANPQLENTIKKILTNNINKSQLKNCVITTEDSKTLMEKADVAAIASGTATLQAAFLHLPYCLVYKVSPITYIIGKFIIKIKNIGIVNILSEKKIVTELVQNNFTTKKLFNEIKNLIENEKERTLMIDQFKKITAKLNKGNSYKNTAEECLKII